MNVLETERLILRRMVPEDAEFILELLNDPSWLRYIGDKGVRNLDDARNYILSGPVAMYEREGFGLYLTERRSDGVPIGICGLIKRDTLKDVDIGFAFLPRFWSNGYAYESASAVLEHGKRDFGLKRIVAITNPENHASARVLRKIGLTFEKMVKLSEDEPEIMLFSRDF